MKTISSFLLLILLVLSSCGNKGDGVRDNVFSLEDIWKSEGSVMLSEIADAVEYVTLQIDQEKVSILPAANRIGLKITQENILTYGRENLVKVFSRNGEFLRVIGGKGKGPGEYMGVSKLLLTPDENEFWVFDYLRRNLLKYSIDGDFLGEIELQNNVAQASIDPKGNLYLMHLEYDETLMDSSIILIVTEEGKEIEQYPLYKNREPGPGQSWSLYVRLYFNDGAIEHFEPPYDTLFRYENDQWNPKWIIDCGSNRLPEEAYSGTRFNEIFQPYSFISMLMESQDYFFISGVHKQQSKLIFAEKSNLRILNCDYKNEKLERPWKYRGMINDIDGGLPFWPRASYEDKYLAKLIDPMDLIDFEPAIGDASEYEKKHRAKLDELMETVDPEGNPIVMIVRLK